MQKRHGSREVEGRGDFPQNNPIPTALSSANPTFLDLLTNWNIGWLLGGKRERKEKYLT